MRGGAACQRVLHGDRFVAREGSQGLDAFHLAADEFSDVNAVGSQRSREMFGDSVKKITSDGCRNPAGDLENAPFVLADIDPPASHCLPFTCR